MATNVTRLKELLFDNEQARLAELARRLELLAVAEQQSRDAISQRLEQATQSLARERTEILARIDELATRAGSDEKFEATMAALLDGAIRDAEKVNHMAMTRAMSPMVVRTITTEFKRKESEILQALIPHTGRLVRDYVNTAMRDLVAEINGKLEAGLKQSPVMLHVRSVMTGRPVAELALAEMAKPVVTDLLLIRRGSGELLAHWPTSDQLSDSDVHLSGILAQINEFALRAFTDDADDAIRTFGSGKSTMYLRASPTTLLVAKVSGPELPGSQVIVNDAFYAITADPTALTAETPALGAAQGGTAGAASAATVDGRATAAAEAASTSLDGLATVLDQRLSAKHKEIAVPGGLGFNPLLALALLIAIPIAAWLAWSFYADYTYSQARAAADGVIAASTDLKIYKPEVDVGPMGRSIRVTGLAPNDEAKRALSKRLSDGVPGATIVDEITLLPAAIPAPDLEPVFKDVRREIVAVETNVKAATEQAVVVRSIARGEMRISQVLSDLATAPLQNAAPRRIAAVESCRRDVRLALDDIRRVRREAGTETVSAEQAQASLVSIHAATDRLYKASSQLTAALLDEPPVIPPATTPPADAIAAAEALAAATERLVAVTLMTVQALKMPPPAPVTTIVERTPAPATPRERLDAWARNHAVFFSNNSDYRDARDVGAMLAELAALMTASSDLIRVVGYTDERGGLARNSTLAKDRADKVAADLIALGVPAARLVAVGRPAGVDISAIVGPQSPNRRVEFEVGFIGEAGVPP